MFLFVQQIPHTFVILRQKRNLRAWILVRNPYLIASEKILESICNSRFIVEGFLVRPFYNSDSRRSFLYFSIISGEI